MKQKICENGHVLVFNECISPNSGGSTIVMGKLMSYFDNDSFTIIATKTKKAKIEDDPKNVWRVYRSAGWLPHKFQWFWIMMQQAIRMMQIRRRFKNRKVSVIFAIYPTLEMLKWASYCSEKFKIPLVVYLHDTLFESLAHSSAFEHVRNFQSKLFSEMSALLVMSDGMTELYRRKYRIDSLPVRHVYSEDIADELKANNFIKRQALFSGVVYNINNLALKRVYDALRACDVTLLLTKSASNQYLASIGIDDFKTDFFADRNHYLKVLQAQDFLILSLNWPDETSMHEDELATIFPTKTPDYLASGRPILLHCPKTYFLAKFFRDNRCGLIVDERSENALVDACHKLLIGGDEIEEYRRNALATAKLFSPQLSVSCVKNTMLQVSKVSWGEKVKF